jgi:hypothetical protein
MATITSFSTSNPGSVGQTLTINGSGLSSTSKVNFGNKSVTPSTVSSATVTCLIPSLCAGQYNVNLTVGTATTNSLPFFYAAAPAVALVNPDTGPAAPGAITLNGSGFLNATAVTFGAIGAGTGLSVVNDTQITITPPAHGTFTGALDTVDVTVTGPGGTSAVTANDQFTYYAAPTVTGISPTTGTAGTSVTVTGTNLASVSNVTFTLTTGGTPISASSITPVSDTQVIAVVPAGLTAALTYDTQAVTPGGTSATSAADVFTAA